jgi:peroxiredoxin
MFGLEVKDNMNSSTLHIGDTAPDFSLFSLNRQRAITLKSLIKRGPAVVEFIRGTW